jgi:hypothetical protein
MSNEAPYQINFKTPKGSLINLRAWSELEFDQGMDALLTRINTVNDIELAIDAICTVNGGGLKVASVTTMNPAPVVTGGAPQADNAPLCEHQQPMRYVPAGISKAGKPYKGFYACSMPREQACKAKA